MNKTGLRTLLKKNWIIVWLVLSVISLAVFFGTAEYITNHNRVKRVIAVTSRKAQLFSSDRLLFLTGDTPEKKWYSIDNKETEQINGFYEVPVHIWNFDPANPKALYDGELHYTLTATLVDGNGNPVTLASMNYQVTENEVTETRTLTIKLEDKDETTGAINTIELKPSNWGGTESDNVKISYEKSHILSESITVNGTDYSNKEHTVTLYFDAALLEEASLNDVRVKLTASPVGHQDLTALSAIIGVKQSTQAPPSGWKGYLQETSSFDEYNGFNYLISGYGEEELTLYYRSDLLEINYWNYYSDTTVESPVALTTDDSTQYPGKFTSGTWQKVIIHANSETKSRYIFQLYLKDDSGTTYQNMSDYVYFPNNDEDDDNSENGDG